ncbi:site-2 protease family protein [Candidatus Uhrbacteria bacterium]|nr:site-2 protease family protein [Candidatus Uhrbacteria bacterium]
MEQAIGPFLPVIITVAALLISLTVHEFSHGFAAYLQGDETAKRMGRLTLNPIPHIDPIGTLLVPALFILPSLIPGSGAPAMLFGWAKPVPFNPYNLRDGKRGIFRVGIAGPLANAILFLASGFALKYAFHIVQPDNFLLEFLRVMMGLNFALMVFNLIPVPPLDGSQIFFSLLSSRYSHLQQKVEMFGSQALMILLFIEFAVYPIIGTFIGFLYSLAVYALFSY